MYNYWNTNPLNFRAWNSNPLNFPNFEHLFQTPRKRSEKCEVCERPTHKGKPFCRDHIDQAPYVKSVQKEDNDLEEEMKLVGRRGEKAIILNSPVVLQIIRVLMVEDGLTVPQVSWETDVPSEILTLYLGKLVLWGMVELIQERQHTLVFLISTTPKLLLTSKEVAARLDVSHHTVNYWAKKGAPHKVETREGRATPSNAKRLFDVEKLTQWYETFKLNAAESRAKSRRRTDWQEIYEDAVKLGAAVAAKRHGMNQTVVRRKIKEMGVPMYMEPIPGSNRTTSIEEAAKILNAKVSTLHKYAKLRPDAPFDRVSRPGGKNRIFLDPEEFRRWLKTSKDMVEALPGSTRKYTMPQAAKMLGISDNKLGKWVLYFGAPHDKIKSPRFKNDKILVDPEEIRQWEQQREQQPRPKLVEPTPMPGSKRTTTMREAAKLLGMRLDSVAEWVRYHGAPHDKVQVPNYKQPKVLVDPEELREWDAGRQKFAQPAVSAKAGSRRTLTPKEAAEVMGIKVDTIRGWISDDNAPHDRIKTKHKIPRILVDPEELLEWNIARKVSKHQLTRRRKKAKPRH